MVRHPTVIGRVMTIPVVGRRSQPQRCCDWLGKKDSNLRSPADTLQGLFASTPTPRPDVSGVVDAQRAEIGAFRPLAGRLPA